MLKALILLSRTPNLQQNRHEWLHFAGKVNIYAFENFKLVTFEIKRRMLIAFLDFVAILMSGSRLLVRTVTSRLWSLLAAQREISKKSLR